MELTNHAWDWSQFQTTKEQQLKNLKLIKVDDYELNAKRPRIRSEVMHVLSTLKNQKTIILGDKIINTQNGVYKQYYEKQRFTDYRIQVVDKIFKVHKMFLSLISPLFDRLFNSNFKESADLYMLDEDPDRFELFLDYLYSGTDFLTLEPPIQLGMIEIALRLEIDLKLVTIWLYIWPIPKDFGIEIWEKYRELMLSLSDDLAPYVLAYKIDEIKFPQDYTWDTNLDDNWAEVKTKINDYLNFRK